MAHLDLDPIALPTGETAYALYRQICAFDEWPETFFIHEGTRVKIKSASLLNEALLIHRVVPEGKTEIDFSQYLASLRR